MADQVKSAVRTLDLLNLVAQNKAGLSFVEICNRTQWPKSSTHGLLATLVEHEFLSFDDDRRVYSIGVRVWEIGQSYLLGDNLAQDATPFMVGLRDQLNETVQLAVLTGTENLYIARVDAFQPISLASRVGVRLPAYATGVGKVLLAGLPNTVGRATIAEIDFVKFTESTIASAEELAAELDAIRERGYGCDDGEYTYGVFCLAAPVANSRSETVAAISVSLPRARVTQDLADRILAGLLDCAYRISLRLGCRSLPDPATRCVSAPDLSRHPANR